MIPYTYLAVAAVWVSLFNTKEISLHVAASTVA